MDKERLIAAYGTAGRRTFRIRSLTAFVLAGAFSCAGAAPASAVLPTGNLLQNSGAESGAGGANETVIDPPPSWTPTASFTATQYGGTGFPTAAQSASIGGGANFFAGGNTALATGTQTVDVSAAAPEIDAGTTPATLSGYVGGYAAQADTMVVTATYLGASNNSLGSLQIGPVTAADRNGQTGLLLRSAAGTVPAGTRSVRVVMTATRAEGTSNDGYADNISLALSNKRPTGTRVVCNYFVATSSDTCTAEVGDGGAAPPVVPGGEVRFTSNEGGYFSSGASCTLVPTPNSSNVASCSVEYIPPAMTFPKVTADYQGDASHAPSSARTGPIAGVFGPDSTFADGSPGSCDASARTSANPTPHQPARPPANAPACGPKFTKAEKEKFRKASLAYAGLAGVAGTGVVFTAATGGVCPATLLACAVLSYVAGNSASQADYYSQLAADPFDRHWRVIAKPRRVRLPSLPSTARSRPAVAGLIKLFRAEAGSAALIEALGITINRTNSAAALKNKVWSRRQLAAAKRYATSAASALDSIPGLSRLAVNALRRAGVRSVSVDANAVRAVQQRVATSGLPAALVAYLKRFAPPRAAAGLRALVLGSNPQTLSGSFPGILVNAKLLAADHSAAVQLRRFVKRR